MSLHPQRRPFTQVYADENQHHGGVHKAGVAAPNAADAKRGKTTTLPAARPMLGDISNVNRAAAHDVVKKPAAAATTFPQIRATAEPVQQHTQQQAAANDAMETDLDDGIQSLSIAPAAQAHAAAPAAPAAYIAPIAPPALYIAIDESDKLNAQMCSEYGPEIQAYWRQAEVRRAPSATYMSRQTDVNPKMREILVDWMVEVQLKFKLKDETLFLSIHLLDRFLERRLTNRTKLQLVGCTALLLAAKYEEIFAPEINDFVAISDNAYTREQILAMEGIMLNSLGFNLTVPLPLNFLQRFARLGGVEQGDNVWQLSMYFMELTLQSYLFLNFPASQIAASALYLSMSTAQQSMGVGHLPVWSQAQQAQIDYTPAQISACVHEMYKLIELNQSGQAKYKAVKKKYSLEKFGSVAKYTCRAPTC